ncbi:MAG: hypothetical protein Q9207_005250 [Kuettlingeria erythrocarpa]
MEAAGAAVNRLRSQIAQTESQLERLKRQLAKAEEEQQENSLKDPKHKLQHTNGDGQISLNGESLWPLSAEDYKRYGRQLILPQIGLEGHVKLSAASVLIVGLGGLGCPAAAYLAGAGVGTIGLIDGDTVDASNLHRQIIHNTSTIGKYKVNSALQYLQQLNPVPKYRTYPNHLRPDSALAIFSQYDLILDCTDHPRARYLISDAAVLADIPVVSASALGLEGQLLVLNDDWSLAWHSYCYRCVHPKPPSPDTIVSCDEGGILGPVVGVMGTLMATEALGLLLRDPNGMFAERSRIFGDPPDQPSMLLYSAERHPSFREVKIKGWRDSCPSCGITPTITEESLLSGSLDYAEFCGRRDLTDVLEPGQRITPTEFIELQKAAPKDHCILVDVRNEIEYELGHVEGSINAPFDHALGASSSDELSRRTYSIDSIFPWTMSEDEPGYNPAVKPEEVSMFTICRQSNDSQRAAKILQDRFPECKFIGDIKGGLEAWRKEVDPSLPDY